MKVKYLFYIMLILSVFSCTKNTDSKACWNLVDYSGNLLSSVCDKTETEVRNYIKNLPGGSSIPDSNLGCFYYKVETDKFCWEINNKCQKNITTALAFHIANCYNGGTVPLKVTCDSCCTNWYNRYAYRAQYWKPTTYSAVFIKKYCGDALDTIRLHKQDTILFNQDTLVTLQFSNNGITW